MNKRASIISIIISIIIAIPGAWLFLSPLLTNVEVSEKIPTSAPLQPTAVPATESPGVEATTAMAIAMMMPTVEMSEKMPEAEMEVLSQGIIYPIAHDSKGLATIYQLSDGARILRLEYFSVDNGPDLHVYLTSAKMIADTVGVELENWIDLGELKGNIGDQNYLLPDDLDLAQVGSVVIWCQPFRVPFSAAPLIGE